MSRSITITGTTISGNTANAEYTEDTIIYEEIEPAGTHAGGVQFTMGDGSVEFDDRDEHFQTATDEPATDAGVPSEEITLNYIEIEWGY